MESNERERLGICVNEHRVVCVLQKPEHMSRRGPDSYSQWGLTIVLVRATSVMCCQEACHFWEGTVME